MSTQNGRPIHDAETGERNHAAAMGERESATGIASEGKASRVKAWSMRVKRIWTKTKLDRRTLQAMAKAALAPTIALAGYLSTNWNETYLTSGYLVAIVAVVTAPMQPRARFLQNLIVLLQCCAISVAVNILAIVCCVKARASASSTTTASYDSSAAAIAGVFLFVEIWLFNYFRAVYPAYSGPSIIIGIYANIALAYAPQFATLGAGIAYAITLLKSVLTGVAISLGVNLFVFPVNMRGVVFGGFVAHIQTTRQLMRSNIAYIDSLETGDMFSRTPTGDPEHPRSVEAQSIKDTVSQLLAIHAKLGVDMILAKREVAWGKLGADDLKEIFRLLRSLLRAVTGFSSLNDIFERTTEQQGWTGIDLSRTISKIDDENERHHAQSVQEWQGISSMLKGPFRHITGHIDDGLAHVLITLELLPRNKALLDLEASSSKPNPGDPNFTDYLGKRVDEFRAKKNYILKQFCETRGIEVPPGFFENPHGNYSNVPEWYDTVPATSARSRYRRQLYTILFSDYLLESIATKVHEFCKYADAKVDSGKLAKSRLVVPGLKRMRKTMRNFLSRSTDRFQDVASDEDGHRSHNIYLGAAFYARRDPEHLPPTSLVQRIGDQFRKFPEALRSKQSVFGIRVALATMSVAIVGLISNTHVFYIENRLFWAQLAVSISMAPSAGQSLFALVLRFIGTFCAMCASLLVWYIVDGHLAGVIVFYWFAMLWGFYVVLKYPRFAPFGIIYSIAVTVIIGYGIEGAELGSRRLSSTGQRYYPTYLLAPYRLAAVATGVFVAWVWTVFPWPYAEHTELRRDLGAALYLLANANSIMDETVRARIRGDAGNPAPDSPYKKLEKARNKVYAKSTLTLQGLRTHLSFVSYDAPIGGRFPTELYIKIVNRVQNIFSFIGLIVHASQTFDDMCGSEAAGEDESTIENNNLWLHDLRRLINETEITSRECTTLLCLLSASVSSGNPLPPYLSAPQAYALAARLDALDRNLLSIRRVADPGFAAFACVQIGTKCIEDDIRALLRDVKILVGELDFSFHTVSVKDPATASRSTMEDGVSDKGKGKHE